MNREQENTSQTANMNWSSDRMSMSFTVSTSPEKRIQESQDEVLRLAQFQPTPCISFGKVAVGKSKVCRLIIENPSGSVAQIQIDHIDESKGVSIKPIDCIIAAGSQRVVQFKWKPEESGNFREYVSIFWNSRIKLRVNLIGEGTGGIKVSLFVCLCSCLCVCNK